MGSHVCPWWMGYLLMNPLRKLWHNPEKILGPHVKEGMTVLDIGSGMGFFSLPAARMVGKSGKVIAVDVQEKMLQGLVARATRAELADRIKTHLCGSEGLGVNEPVDVCVAFNVVHEVPDARALSRKSGRCSSLRGSFCLAEPGHHVSKDDFRATLDLAISVGFRVVGDLGLSKGLTAVCEPAPDAA